MIENYHYMKTDSSGFWVKGLFVGKLEQILRSHAGTWAGGEGGEETWEQPLSWSQAVGLPSDSLGIPSRQCGEKYG